MATADVVMPPNLPAYAAGRQPGEFSKTKFTTRPPPNKWLVTLAISFGSLMGAIGTSSVSVAVPHMRGAFRASVEDIAWVTTGYSVALV